MKHLSMVTDFGSVELTAELREAVRLIVESADVLQVTPGEFCSLMREAPSECPCCAAEKSRGLN